MLGLSLLALDPIRTKPRADHPHRAIWRGYTNSDVGLCFAAAPATSADPGRCRCPGSVRRLAWFSSVNHMTMGATHRSCWSCGRQCGWGGRGLARWSASNSDQGM